MKKKAANFGIALLFVGFVILIVALSGIYSVNRGMKSVTGMAAGDEAQQDELKTELDNLNKELDNLLGGYDGSAEMDKEISKIRGRIEELEKQLQPTSPLEVEVTPPPPQVKISYDGDIITLEKPATDDVTGETYYEGEIDGKKVIYYDPKGKYNGGKLFAVEVIPTKYSYKISDKETIELIPTADGKKYIGRDKEGNTYEYDPAEAGELRKTDNEGHTEPIEAKVEEKKGKEERNRLAEGIGILTPEKEAEIKQQILRQQALQKRKVWANAVYQILNPGPGAMSVEAFLESLTGDVTIFNRTKLGKPWVYFVEGYETKLCEAKMSENIITDYPGHFVSGGDFPDMGAIMFVNAKRNEYTAPFVWGEEVDCNYQPKWFPHPLPEKGKYKPKGYLYKISWHLTMVPPNTLYRIKMSNNNNRNSQCKIDGRPIGEDTLESPLYNSSKTPYKTISYYDLGYYDTICIVFEDWKYDTKNKKYPKDCKQLIKSGITEHGKIVKEIIEETEEDFIVGGSPGETRGRAGKEEKKGEFETGWPEEGDVLG